MNKDYFPEHWNLIKLGNKDYFERLGGGTPRRSNEDYWAGKIKWLTNNEAKDNIINKVSDTNEYITKKGLNNSSTKLIPKESVILSCTASIGKVVINKTEMATNQQFNSFICNKEKINPEFLAYYFLTIKSELEKLAGKTTFLHLTVKNLEKIEVPVPPMNEQKEILAILDELFFSINTINQLQFEIDKVKKSVMSAAISGMLKLNEIFKKNKIPKNWEIKSIKEVIEYSSDSLKPIDYPNKEFNYLGLKNIVSNSGKIVDLEKTNGKEIKSRKRKFNSTNILYGKLRPYLNKVAIPDFNGICSTDILVLKAKKIVVKKYLYYYLLSRYVVDKTTELMSGTNLPRIRKNDFMNLKIPIPPLVTQKNIINKLDQIKSSVDFIIKQQETRDELLEKLPQSILQKAFAGELV
jgi:restriction endonuclease S subunit